ncbi:hypothetical protein HY449_01350 [Candidatus Pacearchaeota archaeon]|nr:hypothetical protein [Candidatus Pacearchaeota archaeon]
MENSDSIEINGKLILYALAMAAILILALMGLGIVEVNFDGKANGNAAGGSYSNIPEKCRPPEGYDIESWKEHLGHHAETKSCLEYFK